MRAGIPAYLNVNFLKLLMNVRDMSMPNISEWIFLSLTFTFPPQLS